MNIKTNSSIGRTYAAVKPTPQKTPTPAELRKDLEYEIDCQHDELMVSNDCGDLSDQEFREQTKALKALDPRVPERKIANFKTALRLATGFVAGAALGYQGGATGAIATGVTAGAGNFAVHSYHFDDVGERVFETAGSTAIGAALGGIGGWFGAVAGGISGAIAVNTLPLLTK